MKVLNALTDALLAKINGIATGAQVNPSDAEIKTAYENNADTNAFTDAEQTKLGGVATGAEVNNISNTDATDLTDGGETTLHTHPGSTPIFGTEFQTAFEGTQDSTSGTAFTQFMRMTTPSLPSGTYRIGVSTLWRTASSSTDMKIQVQVNDTTTLMDGGLYQKEARDSGSDQRESFSMADYYTGSGVLNIDVDFARGGSSNNVYMMWARLEIWRVS